MPYRAPITPWDKNKTFSITCQAYLTRCLHFSTALWSLCYKALAPQASFLVLKQDKFILYRPPLHLLFLLLGTPASLMLKICSWRRLLLIRSINCIPLLTPGLSLSTVLSLFFSQYLTESTHKLPSFFFKKKTNLCVCVFWCVRMRECVCACAGQRLTLVVSPQVLSFIFLFFWERVSHCSSTHGCSQCVPGIWVSLRSQTVMTSTCHHAGFYDVCSGDWTQILMLTWQVSLNRIISPSPATFLKYLFLFIVSQTYRTQSDIECRKDYF